MPIYNFVLLERVLVIALGYLVHTTRKAHMFLRIYSIKNLACTTVAVLTLSLDADTNEGKRRRTTGERRRRK